MTETCSQAGSVALLLNRNAGRVNPVVCRRLAAVVGSEHLYESQDMGQAAARLRTILERGYRTVVLGGGDGTLAHAINVLDRHLRIGGRRPRIALLRLGTGNGLHGVCGAGDPMADLRRLVAGRNLRCLDLPLIGDGRERFLFGGLGYDSQLLRDYGRLSDSLGVGGLPGYVAAAASRSLPRALLNPRGSRLELRAVATGRAWFVDPRGDRPRELEPGATLFEGELRLAAFGVTPFYGYSLRMFPFVNRIRDTLQLRLATLGPLRALASLPSLWRGRYRRPGLLLDYLAEGVRIELARPFPFQHSGEDCGTRERLELRVDPKGLRLVDLGPRMTCSGLRTVPGRSILPAAGPLHSGLASEPHS